MMAVETMMAVQTRIADPAPLPPAVRALVVLIEQDMLDPELLGSVAPCHTAVGEAAVAAAERMLAAIGLPLDKVLPTGRRLLDGRNRPAPPEPAPRGLFPRLACMRPLEGLRVEVSAEAAAWEPKLRAAGAVVVEGDADVLVAGADAPEPAWENDGEFLAEGPVGVGGAALDFFVFDPWTSEERNFTSGAELSDDDVRELVNGGDGDWSAGGVRAWGTDSASGDPPWQDLTLRTHEHARSGDKIYEWNYGLGDNDYGSYHYAAKAAARSESVFFCSNDDGDLQLLEDFEVAAADERALASAKWCLDQDDLGHVEATPLARFKNAAFQSFAHKLDSWATVRDRRAGRTTGLMSVRGGMVSDAADRGIGNSEFGPTGALLRVVSLEHCRSLADL